MENLQDKYDALLAEVEELRRENAEMKKLLFEHGLSYVPKSAKQKASIVSLYSSITFPPISLNAEQRIAAFKNQEFFKNPAMRISTFGIQRIISCADFTDEYICMPRGCEDTINQVV